MKIHSPHTTPRKRLSRKWLLLLLIPLLWSVGQTLYRYVSGETEEVLFCNMEKVSEDGQVFIGKRGKRLTNGHTQSEDVAFSGTHSAACTAQQKFGPTAVFPDLSAGDLIEASVWRYAEKGEGALVLEGDWGYWDAQTQPAQKKANWEKLQIRAQIPRGVSSATIKVYPLFKGGEIVYFDDLRIRVLRRNRGRLTAAIDSFPHLDIQVDEQAYRQLKAKREEALQRGNLIAGKKDLVPARLHVDNRNIPAKIRLKGDLLDHLQGKKWSFRILCEEGYNWRGMHIFSVHNAASRYYLDEWIYHRLLLDEDLLTTPYDFLKVSLNGDFLGIYAFEEHFTDELLLSQGREPGVIVRIDEAGHWLQASQNLKDRPAWYQSAAYLPYERKKMRNDPHRFQQWLRAQELLYGFFKGELKPAEVFDTARMARFIAITDLARAFHALNFTNIRFYYDPLHDRLEPLGYDGYSTDGTRWFQPPAIFGSHYNSRSKNTYRPGVEDAYLAYRLFNDTSFTKKYLRALNEVTSEEFVNDFLQRHLPQMELREEFLREEYTAYDFKWADYFQNAKEIQKLLNPLALTSVKAWAGDAGQLVLENYFLFPIEVVGFGDGQKVDYKLETPFFMEAYDRAVPVKRYEMTLPRKYKYIFVRTLGLSKLHRERITKWQAPKQPQIWRKPNPTPPDFVRDLGEKVWLLPSGKYVFYEDWLLPSGHLLRVGPGVEIDLQDGAMIVSEASLDWQGTAENPIRIYSSDQSGGGVLLLEAAQKSFLSHVYIEGMRDRRLQPPFTRASFTVFQSEVVLAHILLKNSGSENALHLLQSKYQIEDLLVRNAAGDAVDADRSTGEMFDVHIERCGEDGIEISSGFANLKDLYFREVREAGIRAGSGAEVVARNISLENCQQGLAAHDGAVFRAEHITAENLRQLLLAYRKNDEAAAGGRLEVKQVNANQVDLLYLLDNESEIIIDGESKTSQ